MFGALISSGAKSDVSPTPVRSYVMPANGVVAGRTGVLADGAAEGAAVGAPWAASGPAANASAPTASAQYLWVIEEISSESVERHARRARSEATTPRRARVVRVRGSGAAGQWECGNAGSADPDCARDDRPRAAV